MMKDKMREEFENIFSPPEWSGFDCASNEYFLLWDELDWREVDEELNRYNRDWQVWQASRAALAVNLPEPTWSDAAGEEVYSSTDVGFSLTVAGIRHE